MKKQASPQNDVSTGGGSDVTTQSAGPVVGGEQGQAFALQGSVGNAGVQEMVGQGGDDVAQEEGGGEGLSNYQAALGKTLGTKLYDALSEHLTMEKMGGYANDGLTGAIEGVVGLLEDMETDPGAVDKFAEALSAQYATLASEWLEANPQVVDAVRGWVDEHPTAIAITAVTAALLAAAAAILTDQDIPELKHTFKVGDALTADVAAKLGSLQNIALEKISAKLQYTAGNIQAGLEIASENLDGFSGAASLTVGDEERQASLRGEFDEDGLSLYKFSGLWGLGEGKTLKGESSGDASGLGVSSVTLESVDGENIRSKSLAYNAQSDIFTVSDAYTQVFGSSSLTTDLSQSSDGTSDFSASYENSPEGDTGLSTRFSLGAMIAASGAENAYDLTPTQRVGFGLTYTTKDLEAEFDAAFSSDGVGSLSGNLTNDFGDGHTAGTNLDLTLGGDERLLDIGAFYNFRDPDSFTGFSARYGYTGDNDTHQANLMVQYKLGEIYTRLEQEAVLSPEGQRFQTSASGAYFLDNGIGLIGGVKYQADEAGNHDFMPMVGAQVGGVPLTVTYNPRDNGVMVGLSIPFGN